MEDNKENAHLYDNEHEDERTVEPSGNRPASDFVGYTSEDSSVPPSDERGRRHFDFGAQRLRSQLHGNPFSSGYASNNTQREEEPNKKKPLFRTFKEAIPLAKAYIKRHWGVVYWIPIVIFVIFAVIFGENNLYQQIKLSRRIHQLERRIEDTEKKQRKDKEYLESRQKDDFYDIEALARRQYGLKKEGEMVFLLIDTAKMDYQKEEKPFAQ